MGTDCGGPQESHGSILHGAFQTCWCAAWQGLGSEAIRGAEAPAAVPGMMRGPPAVLEL